MPTPNRNKRLEKDFVSYLLNDSFYDTKAVGAVNGSLVTPGPQGTRTVFDDGNYITVSPNQLYLESSGTGSETVFWNNPIFTNLVDGRMAIFRRRITVNVNESGSFGWHNTGTAFTTRTGVIGAYVNNLAVRASVSGGGANVLQDVIVGDFVDVAFIMATPGGYFFSKKNGTGNWILGYINNVLTSTNIRCGVGLRAAALNTAAYDFVRIPYALWLPNPLVFDSFDRTDGALGTTEDKGAEKQPTIPRTWSGSSTFSISTNKVINTPDTSGTEMTSNPGFEDGNPPTDWTMNNTPTTYEQSNAQAHGGTYSLHIINDAANEGATQSSTMVLGQWYRFQVWAYRVSGTYLMLMPSASNYGVYNNIPATTWTKLTTICRRFSASNNTHGVGSSSAAGETFWDDYSLIPMTFTEFISAVQVDTSDFVAGVNITLESTVVNRCPAGLIFCLDDPADPQNFIIAFANADGSASHAISVDKCVDGVYTNLGRTNQTYAAGAQLVVKKDGASLIVVYNNSTILSTTLTDDVLINGTQIGLFNTLPGNSLDNFQVFPVGNKGEYSILDRYVH